MINGKITLGVIISNRDFFPDVSFTEGRKELLAVLDELGIGYVLLGENDTPLGAIETWEHAKKCGALFQPAPWWHRRHLCQPAELRRRKGRGRHASSCPGSTSRFWYRRYPRRLRCPGRRQQA